MDSNAEISVSGPFNREFLDRYTVTLIVEDVNIDCLRSRTLIVLHIADENDNAPIFALSQFEVTIREDLIIGRIFFTEIATDLDIGTNAQLNYTLSEINGSSIPFIIDPMSAAIEISAALNGFTNPSYSLIITATDGGTPPLSGSTTLTINIETVNTSPAFTISCPAAYSIPENQTIGIINGIIFTAMDLDTGPPFSTIYFNLSSNIFSINSNSGQLYLNSTLDRETQPQYMLSIFVTDGGGRTDECFITIEVTDINDNPPIFNMNSYIFSLDEEEPSQALFQVTVTDLDIGNNSRYSLSLIGTDSQGFGISSDGTVSSTEVFNYETLLNPILSFNIVATGFFGVYISMANATINITDINDNTPQFNNIQINQLPENSSSGSIAVQFSVSDADSGIFGTVEASIQNSNNGIFALSNTNNDYTINLMNSNLDFETTRQYLVTIRLADGGTPPRETQMNFEINVTDVNDNTPICTSIDLVTIPENLDSAFIAQILATDADQPNTPNSNIMYSIISINQTNVLNNNFSINSTSGILLTNSFLDIEQFQSYQILVRASDQGSPPLFCETIITLNLEDVNEFVPVINQTATGFNITIREDAPEGFRVATIQATDADISAQLIFGISSPIGVFSINPNSGIITLAMMLDYETTPSYSLVASVTDNITMLFSTINIIVENVNDIVPQLNVQFPIEISENLVSGTNVTCPTVIDGDGDANGVFNLTLSSMEFFSFNPATFCIILTQSLDREGSNGDSISLDITVNDNGSPNLLSTRSYTIFIIDVNDNPPIFQNDPYSGTIQENSVSGPPILSVLATDRDIGINGEITYSLNSTQFSINNDTGEIALSGSVDFELSPIIYLEVNATDQVHVDTALVIITVTDVNDNVPIIDPISSITITENGSPNTFVVNVTATDTDQNQAFTFSINPITPNNIPNFIINTSTGSITVNASSFDREVTDQYVLNVLVSDGMFTAQVAIIVIIADANDNAPFFVNLPTSLTFLECANCSVALLQVSVNDFDQLSPLNSIISTASINDSRFFVVNTDDMITIFCNSSQTLDFETEPTFIVLLTVTDSGTPPLSSTATLQINLINCNDNPPILNVPNIQMSLPENTVINTLVAQFNASDADQINGVGITYSFSLTGTDYLSFAINSTTGAVLLIQSLDFEQKQSYTLMIIAQDSGSPPLTTQGILTVTVTDIDDNPPMFTQNQYMFSLLENTTVNSIVYDAILASDNDTVNNEINYTLSTPSNQFQINSTTASLQLIAPLDYEINTSYTLFVVARSGVFSTTATVMITIIDVNDEPPVITNTDFAFSISEDTQIGAITVFDVNAMDPDTQTLTYSITPGTTFTINSEGVVTTIVTLDREAISSYSVNVSVSDGLFSDSQIFTVEITDINDNSPEFNQTTYTFSVEENSPIGTVFNSTSPLATDRDLDLNALINYTGIDTGPFNISRVSGSLIVAMEIDFETTPSYEFTVTATDGGTSSLASSVTFIVNILNVNDNPPVFSPSSYSRNIAECNTLTVSCSCVMIVLTVTATDADNDPLNFTLPSSVSPYFTINSSSGAITSTCNLDYEMHNMFAFNVTASDGMFTDTAQILITLTDVNDNRPIFIPNSNISLSVYENIGINTVIIVLNASDLDSDLNSLLEYSFNAVSPSGNVSNIRISGNEIILANQFDFEANALFVYTLTVTDMGSPSLSSTIYLTINILDVNDNSPVFNNSITSFDIRENETPSNIICLTATDRDSGNNGDVSFSIAVGLFSTFFNLTGCNLSLVQAFDREIDQTASLTILAIDNGSPRLTSSIILSFPITDLNDNTPQFSQMYGPQSILESESAGSQVLTISATDADSTSPNSDIRYSISVLYCVNSLFNIETITGSITVGGVLDFETNSFCTLNVTARDLGTDPQTNYNSITIVINITNVNDNTPAFNDSNYLFYVLENSPLNTEIGRTPASDADLGEFGIIMYAVQSSEDNNTNINEFRYNTSLDSLLVLNSTIDFEIQSVYTFRVIAFNPAINSNTVLETISSVIVQVIDVNDNTPIFDNNSIIATIIENVPINTTVTQLFATDRDQPNTPNSQITFSLNDTSFFNVSQVGNQANIYTISTLDRETIAIHYLTVLATDNGSPQLTGTAYVTIIVSDFNDNPPLFTNSSQNVTLPENFPIGITVARFEITDLDIGLGTPNTYTINGSTLFMINNTGYVTLAAMLDFESARFYNLTIIASDGSLFSSATLLVYVTDVNEATPIFSNLTYDVDLDENAALGLILVTVSATDADIFQTIAYSLTSPSASTSSSDLLINSTTGVIQTNRVFDFEMLLSNPILEFILRAVDSGNPQRTGFATLRVTIINLNDNSPMFSLDAMYNISENTAINETVFTLLATDAETSTNLITYSLSISPSSSAFRILSTGTVQVSSILDIESQVAYDLTITAFDNGTPQRNTTRSTTIMLTDFNDNSPIYSQFVYTLNITENMANNTDVLTVSSTDSDVTSPNNVPTFSISNNIYLIINAMTGVISTLAPFDREEVSMLNLTLGVCDNGSPQLCGSNSQLQITVQDVNDNPPMFVNAPYTLTLPEVFTTNSLLTVSVVDLDAPGTPNSEITLTLTNTNCFTINSLGQIFYSPNFIPDFDTTPTLTAIIIATDSGIPPRSSNTTLTVDLTDVNDNVPILTIQPNTVGISESSPVSSSVVVNISASDSDSGLNGEILYSLETHDTLFFISSSTGELTLISSLDFEVLPNTYNVVIRATDRGNPPLFSTANLTINVLDANDNFPLFPYPNNFTVTTIEEMEVPYALITITTSDADSEINAISAYSIVPVTDGTLSKFTINQTSGEITVINRIDREVRDYYEFYVVVNNTASPFLSSQFLLRVYVTDINDNPPSINPISISVSESRVSPIILNSFQVTDADIGENGEILNVSISESTVFFVNMTSSNLYSIYLIGNLDFEITQSYSLFILAYDNGTPPLHTNVSLLINVTNENDNTPMFTQSPYTVSILENTTVSTVILTITANDADLGDPGRVNLTLSTSNSFQLDSIYIFSPASLTTISALDYETRASYTLTVTARDNAMASSQRINTTEIIITILDVNDNAPVIISPTEGQMITVPESTSVAEFIFTVSAEDADQINTLNSMISFSFSIGSNTSQYFQIDSATGRITLSTLLDFEVESERMHNITVIAADSGNPSLSSSVNFIILITDVNDNSPIFENSSITITVNENQQPQEVQFTANDGDSGPAGDVVYSITPTNGCSVTATIQSNTGVVSFTSQFDYEQSTLCIFQITALDKGDPQRNSTALLTVYVSDVNDNAPIFANVINSYNISENISSGNFLRVLASDADGTSPNNLISYSFANGFEVFAINSSTGDISVIGQLDYEQTQRYMLEIIASDNGSPQMSSEIILTVNIEDANDNSPMFNPALPQSINVTENRNLNFTVLTAVATDIDSGDNAQINYMLSSTGGNIPFIISSEGVITVSGVIDREAVSSYVITVIATDMGNPAMSTQSTLTIYIDDVNDNFPVFTGSPYMFSVAENQNIGVLNEQLVVTDRDIGLNAQLECSIFIPNILNVSSGFGVITNVMFDREENSEYNFTVSCSDISSSPLTSTTQLTLTITDVNDNAPIIPDDYTFEIRDDVLPNTIIGTIQATDADDPNTINGIFTFSIDSTTSSTYVSINATTGVLYTTNANGQILPASNIVLIVLATDMGVPALSGNATVNITIIDINNNAPNFTASSSSIMIPENTPVNSIIANVTAFDDETSNLTYSISSDPEMNQFSINSMGAISVSLSLDYETVVDYTLTILAADQPDANGLRNTGTTIILVQITDINDNSPVYNGLPYMGNIDENQNGPVCFLFVSATDADSGNFGIVTYGIESSNFLNVFSINSTSGEFCLRAGQFLNFEGDFGSAFTVPIIAMDQGTPPRNTREVITITINNLNEFAPVFTSQLYNASVLEEHSINTSVSSQIEASDDDSGLNGQIVYSINGTTSFIIDPNTAQLYTTEILDREQIDSYTFSVIANDLGNPSLSSTATVLVIVVDINDNCPTFSQIEEMLTIPEGQSSEVLQLINTVTDNDIGINAELNYSLGNFQSTFDVDPTTGQLSLLSILDREEVAIYNITLIARDLGVPSCTALSFIIITVDDVNDNVPQFIGAPYTVNITEEMPANTTIFTVIATDADEEDNALFTLLLESNAHFQIDPDTGIISTRVVIDRDVLSSNPFVLTITARENNLQTNTTTITIYIMDLNDNPPVCTMLPFMATFPTISTNMVCHI